MSEIIGYNDKVILDQYGASIGDGDGSRSSRPTCSEWIRCADQLPTEGQMVLGWDGRATKGDDGDQWGFELVRLWPDGKFHEAQDCMVCEITHWMPLPNPPNAELWDGERPQTSNDKTMNNKSKSNETAADARHSTPACGSESFADKIARYRRKAESKYTPEELSRMASDARVMAPARSEKLKACGWEVGEDGMLHPPDGFPEDFPND